MCSLHTRVVFYVVLWSTESSGQLWNACLWDLHSGSIKHTFKGGVSAPNSLCIVRNDFLVSGELGKPLLHHWLICKKDSKQTRIVLPGKVGALAVTNDGHYCVAAIGEKLHIWQLGSGRLLAIVSAHYQPITSVCVTSNGSHLLTAGEDAIVHSWSLSGLVDQTSTVQSEPIWSSSNHSLPVTDLHVGSVGAKARVVSVSLDQSCRVYDILSGEQIAVFMFDSGLSKVTANTLLSTLYIGMVTGSIYKLHLHVMPVKSERHIRSDAEDSSCRLLTGHSKEVTCLSLNLDSSILASGSKDMSVRLWHTSSGQCIRTLTHKGPITNLLITQYPSQLASEKYLPRSVIKQFDRHLYNSKEDGEGQVELYTTTLHSQEEDLLFCKKQLDGALHTLSAKEREVFTSSSQLPDRSHSDVADRLRQELDDSRRQLSKALASNRELYEFSVQRMASAPTAASNTPSISTTATGPVKRKHSPKTYR